MQFWTSTKKVSATIAVSLTLIYSTEASGGLEKSGISSRWTILRTFLTPFFSSVGVVDNFCGDGVRQTLCEY